MWGIDPVLSETAALALAAVFGASGAMKLADLEMFAGSVANYRLLPRWMERPFAVALALAESGCAAGLLLAATRAAAATAIALLLAAFTAAIAINIARGRSNIDCGCFGAAIRQSLGGWLLLRNFVLLALAAALWTAPSGRPIGMLDLVTTVLGATSLVVVYAAANVAIGNTPRTRALEMI